MNLFSEDAIRERLRRLGVAPKKHRGQNFLFETSAIQQILRFANVDSTEQVLEIGPGLGVLTDSLRHVAKSLAVVEIEPIFADALNALYPTLQIIRSDIRKIELTELSAEKFVIVSNVPYSISTDVVLWLFRERTHVKRASLLFQREFAERLASGPGSRAYGSLSVLRELYAQAELGEVIPGSAFCPKANVESRLIGLRFRDHPLLEGLPVTEFETFVRAAFSKRRKTLLNSLQAVVSDKKELQRVLESCGIDPSRRAETLSLAEFVGLFRAVDQPRNTDG